MFGVGEFANKQFFAIYVFSYIVEHTSIIRTTTALKILFQKFRVNGIG